MEDGTCRASETVLETVGSASGCERQAAINKTPRTVLLKSPRDVFTEFPGTP